VIGTSVRGVRGSVRIDTTNKSASAEIGEATNGVNARDEPKTNFATASSGARANGRIEGHRKALQSGKRAAAKWRCCRSYNLGQ
jgi:hypothetical protein